MVERISVGNGCIYIWTNFPNYIIEDSMFDESVALTAEEIKEIYRIVIENENKES